MDQNKNTGIGTSEIEVDPDYESTNIAIRNVELKEEEENKLTENKLRKIIQEEFDKELETRQKHIEEIEEKIFKAQKLLHIVRYVLISSYYNNKALEWEGTSNSTLECTNILTGQNRIHPAVKKLLGSNVNNLKFLTARTKRKVSSSKLDTGVLSQPERKKMKLDASSLGQSETLVIDQVKLDPVKMKVEQEVVTNRTKTQHRVIVGNISYFKKSLEQDNITHKWMVYVKVFNGTKEGPEVSNVIIKKVVFYLHPSYQPHDVVEISQPPYHLSRRGWGEFPLRVQIFFQSTMNKPVDIIHKLKLDKTFTERPTVGNETIVPIFLYDDSIPNIKFEDEDKEMEVKNHTENLITTDKLSNSVSNNILSINEIKTEPASTSFEHDYCFDNQIDVKEELEFDTIEDDDLISALLIADSNSSKENNNYCIRDHCYSLPRSKEDSKSSLGKKNAPPVRQTYNELIYGLGPNYLDPVRSKNRNTKPSNYEKVKASSEKNPKNVFKVLKTVTGQSIRFLPESFSQVLLRNGNIVQVKFIKQNSQKTYTTTNDISFLDKLATVRRPGLLDLDYGGYVEERVPYEKYALKLPKNKFKNMGEALPYLFKRLPLWTREANDVGYKCTYPFTARMRREYSSWNIGKRLSAEWSRAKAIKKILQGEKYSKNWNTKAIFMYGRSHLYTPVVPSYKLFAKESPEKYLISNCYADSNVKNGCSDNRLVENEESINITSPEKDHSSPQCLDNSFMDISDKRLMQECAFVKDAALDCGVILRHEEIIKGVVMNASERLILEAVKRFAENLIRRSRHYLVCRENFNENTAVVTTNEIREVLEERKEFLSIKKFQESKITMDFFS